MTTRAHPTTAEDMSASGVREAALSAEVERLRRQLASTEAGIGRGDAHLRRILDSAMDFAIVATDLDGLVTRWSDGARRVLGWSEDEMLGQPVDRFFTPEDVATGRVATEMRNALDTGRGNDERWHQRKGGERFWAVGEMTVLRDEQGAAVGFVKVLRDRTEQRHAEERQRADAEFMRGVLASSSDCIKVLDLDGNLTFMSEGGQRVMEVGDFNAIKGCPWPDFWQGPGRAKAASALATAKAGGVGRFQGPADTVAGTPRHWDVQVTAIMGADGKPERLLSISRDITATWQAETAVRESEAELRMQR
ncbi:MAG: PAS domain-containing protein, partial [Janthinobacterium lividum]